MNGLKGLIFALFLISTAVWAPIPVEASAKEAPKLNKTHSDEIAWRRGHHRHGRHRGRVTVGFGGGAYYRTGYYAPRYRYYYPRYYYANPYPYYYYPSRGGYYGGRSGVSLYFGW